MTRAKKSSRRDSRDNAAGPSTTGPGLDALTSGLTGLVVVCRLLTPTEGAALGETLWIAQLALFALLVRMLAAYRAGGAGWRLDLADGAVGLIVLGQTLSAALNFGQADRRALVNMLWEWCGLLATWLLLRRLADRPNDRRSLVVAVLAVAVVSAGLGLWQHYFGFEETRREVARLQHAWDELEREGRPADPAAALAWEKKHQRLRAEFVRQGIPTEGPERQQWNQRLFASTEPLGLFALTNTLAGFLLVALVLCLGGLVEGVRRRLSRPSVAALAGFTLLLAYCLLLTKSRTAYVGLLVGLAATIAGRRGLAPSCGRVFRWGALAALVLAGLAGAAVLTGAVDREVITQSFKSLRYRGEYWVGTWRMLLDGRFRWLSGVGPGNFRAFYLQYKLPESSEEIADPHNLFLDVWSGGGLVAVAGLALLLVAGLRGLRPVPASRDLPGEVPGSQSSAEPGPDRGVPVWQNPVLVGAVLAFLVVHLFGGGVDDQMLPLACGWIAAVAAAHSWRRLDIPGPLFAAACGALAVHLLGAGGIAMPAITQTLLLVVAFGQVGLSPIAVRSGELSRRGAALGGVCVLGLYLGCWFTAVGPVMNARAALLDGEQALFEEGRWDSAERSFRRAAEADPLGAEACERLAELALQRWLAEGGGDLPWFDQCVYWYRQAIIRRPHDYRVRRLLGGAYLERFRRSGAPADAALAADELADAVSFNPQHAGLVSELAEAYWRAGELPAARADAERALELDDLNRKLGHRDKELTEPRRALLGGILTAK